MWLIRRGHIDAIVRHGGLSPSPCSRELIGTVIPRWLSFILGIVSYTVLELDPFGKQEDLSREIIESLSTAVRFRFDSRKINIRD
jgi:hypothetical protein